MVALEYEKIRQLVRSSIALFLSCEGQTVTSIRGSSQQREVAALLLSREWDFSYVVSLRLYLEYFDRAVSGSLGYRNTASICVQFYEWQLLS